MSSKARKPSPLEGGWRASVTAVLLVLSLLLTVVLSAQAWYTATHNSTVAQRVMRDYAQLVVDEFARRSYAALGYEGYYGLLSAVLPEPTPQQMAAAARTLDAAALAQGYFRYDGSLSSTGDVPKREQLARALDQQLGQAAAGGFGLLQLPADVPGSTTQVVYGTTTDPQSQPVLAGFVVDPNGVAQLLDRVASAAPLLPPTLADGGVANDRLFLRVVAADGSPWLERNPQFEQDDTRYSRVLGEDYQAILQGVSVQAGLDQEAAASLIIGGLPRSQLPALAVVTLLAAALLLAALWLLQRERAVTRLRADFVSQVSHELRTPLTQICMFAETLLLARERNADERERALKVIHREARRLAQLVDNMLRFSRFSADSMADRRVQALAPILEEVCDTVQTMHGEARVRLEADPTVTANVDSDAVRQIVLNLLENAIKYGPPQQCVQLAVTGDGEAALISVEDEGPGIPARESSKVWRPFYRLPRERESARSGTGVGLSVVRELVIALGGQCWIETASNGQGTRVCVRFHGDDQE